MPSALNSGGPVTQQAGAPIVADDLLLVGAGPYTLTETTNNVSRLAASVTNAVSYTNAVSLTIPPGADLSPGDRVDGGSHDQQRPIAIDTIDGFLTVANVVIAGSSTVSLTAGDPNGVDPDLTINAPVIGAGGVTLTADNMVITAPVIASIATLQPFASGTDIDLGGVDTANTLGLTQAELNNLRAGIVRIGDFSNTNNITVTAEGVGSVHATEVNVGAGCERLKRGDAGNHRSGDDPCCRRSA